MAFIYNDLHPSWKKFFDQERTQPYFKELEERYAREVKEHTVFPSKENIFRVFRLSGPEDLKCVVLGQDPYPSPGMANGLAFSVASGQKLPASLRNIFKEYQSDLALPAPADGNLEPWAKAGVFLLNTALTVREKEAGAHLRWGWEQFTLAALVFALKRNPAMGVICFGKPAKQRVVKALTLAGEWPTARTFVCTPHPSPLSAYRGFYGSKPFSTFNAEQEKRNRPVVQWELPAERQNNLFSVNQ